MDFTYPLAAVLAAVLALFLSLVALLISGLSKRDVPRGYSTYIALLVVLFVAALSLRWSDWRNILLTTMGLLDLAYILAFSAVGTFIGTVPLWFFGKSRQRQRS
jgi:hypothetical protein